MPTELKIIDEEPVVSFGNEQMKNDNDDGEADPMLSSGADASQNKKGWTVTLIQASSAAVLGSSFQFGYNTGVINAPGNVIQQFINETYFDRHGSYIDSLQLKLLWGVTVSILAIGGMIGSLASGYFAGRYGRKKAMLGNNVLALIASVLMGVSKLASSFELLIIGRLVIGFNCGMNTALAPLYLTEIAPVHLRGFLGTMNQVGIVTAMLISQVLGLSQLLGSPDRWPFLLAFTAIFAVYQLIVLPFCPETPQHLLSKGWMAEAERSLQELRGRQDVEQEMSRLVSERDAAREEERISIPKIFAVSHLRQPMIIAIVMQLSQQLSGINAAFYYSTDIFISANVSPSKSDIVTMGMGVVNICMTLLSLLLIEKLGRRILHLTGLAGMFCCSLLLVVSLTAGKSTAWGPILSVVSVMLFVMSFQTGPGSIPWFITAELFGQGARGSAISLAGLVNWTGNFLVGIGYPPLEEVIDGFTFIIFAVLLAFFFVFTYFRVPETKGKSIEEITSRFKGQ